MNISHPSWSQEREGGREPLSCVVLLKSMSPFEGLRCRPSHRERDHGRGEAVGAADGGAKVSDFPGDPWVRDPSGGDPPAVRPHARRSAGD